MRVKIIVLILILYLVCNAAVTSGVRGLSFTTGARVLGIGETSVTDVGDVYFTYLNPATLSKVKTHQIGLAYFKSLDDTFYAFAGYAFPVEKNQTMECSIAYFDGGS